MNAAAARPRLVLFGVSSPYAAEALESIRRAGAELVAAVCNRPELPVPPELETAGVIVPLQAVGSKLLDLPFLVPLTTPGFRQLAEHEARRAGFTRVGSLVDPTATVAASAQIALGSYVNARAIIAAGVCAGHGLSVNRGASLGHHSTLEEYVTVGPGAVTGGGCRLGRGAFLGVGAVLAPEVAIGRGAVVGAGAVVIADVEDGAVVVGNPARVIRHGPGYGGVAVSD